MLKPARFAGLTVAGLTFKIIAYKLSFSYDTTLYLFVDSFGLSESLALKLVRRSLEQSFLFLTSPKAQSMPQPEHHVPVYQQSQTGLMSSNCTDLIMRIVIQRERTRAKIEGQKQEEMIVVSSFSSHDCVCGEKGTVLDLWVYFVLIHYWLHLLELVKSTSYVSHLKKITASTSWLKSSSGILNPVGVQFQPCSKTTVCNYVKVLLKILIGWFNCV